MPPLIIHGRPWKPSPSPREGRENCDLWGVTRSNVKFWGGKLLDWCGWFDIHPLVQHEGFPGIPERRPEMWAWLKEQDGSRPIYMFHPDDLPAYADRALARKRFDEIPGATGFPIRQIQDAFPINGQLNTWFICQMGMMIAFALHEGRQKIILNGVGDLGPIAHQHVHRDTLYWLAFARGMGVAVEIEGPSVYHAPQKIYSYGKLNYAELEAGKIEELFGPNEPSAQQLRDIARGRPVRRRPGYRR